MNVVLDTNSLIMAISSKSNYNRVWRAFLQEEYTLCVTNEIIEEYVEVISRNISPTVAESVIYVILSKRNVIKINPHYRFELIQNDKDDNKFVDCAIAANAQYIVTEDRHFRILNEIPFPHVTAISIDDFVLYLNRTLSWSPAVMDVEPR